MTVVIKCMLVLILSSNADDISYRFYEHLVNVGTKMASNYTDTCYEVELTNENTVPSVIINHNQV